MEESELPHAHGDSGSPNRTSAPFCNMGFVPLITHPPKVHPSSPIMHREPISQNDKHLLLTTTYLLPVPVNTWPSPPSAIGSTTYETFQFPANLNSSIWSFKLNICISLRNPFPKSTNATRIFDTKGCWNTRSSAPTTSTSRPPTRAVRLFCPTSPSSAPSRTLTTALRLSQVSQSIPPHSKILIGLLFLFCFSLTKTARPSSARSP